MTKGEKFWLAWCAFFAVLDVVFGVRRALEGEWGWAAYEFLFALVMALCFVVTYLSARRRQQRECLVGWKVV